MFLMGDWNLNLMNHSCHQATGEFLHLMFSRMFFPLITRPTRITSPKASLIDNIFTNEPLNQSISGLFLNDISDHLPIFAVISGYEQTFDRNKYFTFRSKNLQNLTKFKSEKKSEERSCQVIMILPRLMEIFSRSILLFTIAAFR